MRKKTVSNWRGISYALFTGVLGLTIILSGCGSSKSLVEQACDAYKIKDYDLADSKFAELVRNNYDIEDYRELRSDLALVIRFARREIDAEGWTTSPGIRIGGDSPMDAQERLNYFCY
jgi:hypothetical protein